LPALEARGGEKSLIKGRLRIRAKTAMSDTTDRTESIFAAAVELTNAEERSTLLERACAGDSVLRARIEALLRAHARIGHVLDQPVPGDLEAIAAESAGLLVRLYEATGNKDAAAKWRGLRDSSPHPENKPAD
jgi:hypothetical protein